MNDVIIADSITLYARVCRVYSCNNLSRGQDLVSWPWTMYLYRRCLWQI